MSSRSPSAVRSPSTHARSTKQPLNCNSRVFSTRPSRPTRPTSRPEVFTWRSNASVVAWEGGWQVDEVGRGWRRMWVMVDKDPTPALVFGVCNSSRKAPHGSPTTQNVVDTSPCGPAWPCPIHHLQLRSQSPSTGHPAEPHVPEHVRVLRGFGLRRVLAGLRNSRSADTALSERRSHMSGA